MSLTSPPEKAKQALLTGAAHLDTARAILDKAPKPLPSVVVDIGAKLGAVTILALKEYGVKFVVATEADPGNYQALIHNVVANGLWGKVLALPVAVTGWSQRKDLVVAVPILQNVVAKSFPAIMAMARHFSAGIRLEKKDDPGEIFLKADFGVAGWDILGRLNTSDMARVRAIDIEVALDGKTVDDVNKIRERLRNMEKFEGVDDDSLTLRGIRPADYPMGW